MNDIILKTEYIEIPSNIFINNSNDNDHFVLQASQYEYDMRRKKVLVPTTEYYKDIHIHWDGETEKVYAKDDGGKSQCFQLGEDSNIKQKLYWKSEAYDNLYYSLKIYKRKPEIVLLNEIKESLPKLSSGGRRGTKKRKHKVIRRTCRGKYKRKRKLTKNKTKKFKKNSCKNF